MRKEDTPLTKPAGMTPCVGRNCRACLANLSDCSCSISQTRGQRCASRLHALLCNPWCPLLHIRAGWTNPHNGISRVIEPSSQLHSASTYPGGQTRGRHCSCSAKPCTTPAPQSWSDRSMSGHCRHHSATFLSVSCRRKEIHLLCASRLMQCARQLTCSSRRNVLYMLPKPQQVTGWLTVSIECGNTPDTPGNPPMVCNSMQKFLQAGFQCFSPCHLNPTQQIATISSRQQPTTSNVSVPTIVLPSTATCPRQNSSQYTQAL